MYIDPVELIAEGGHGYAEVLDAYMEEEPFIAKWDELSESPNVVVVPFFIADGLHSYQDIPVMLGIERELTAARAVDLETACLLTEAAIGEMDEPDVVLAVRELKSRKPFLFSGVSHGIDGGAGYGNGSAMSAVAGNGTGTSGHGLGQLASSARSSGDRNELLRYLRARRGG